MDVRVWAFVCVVIGMLTGLGLSVSALGYLTAFLIGLVTVFLYRTNKNAPGGTSGAMGLTFTIVGAMICLLIPAWMMCLLK
jgi:hypothetical protein